MGITLERHVRGAALEEALAALLYDPRARERLRSGTADDPLFGRLDLNELDEAARTVRRMVLERTHRGTGDLTVLFSRTIAAWKTYFPNDTSLDNMLSSFCSSAACAAWREGFATNLGLSFEEAFFRFFSEQEIGDRDELEEEFLGAMVRALAISPRARFVWPAQVLPAPGGCYAITRRHILHAALDGRYQRGPVTPLVVALLSGRTVEETARNFGVGEGQITAVVTVLRAKRLIR